MQSTEVRRSSLQTAFDIAVAPQTACLRLRAAPTWVWAFALSTILGIVATLVISPVTQHAMGLELPARFAANPQFAQLPPAERTARIAQAVSVAQTVARFSFVFIPVGVALGSVLQALVMLIANAIGRGDGTFAKFWALAVNAALIGTGISSIVLMLIVLLRGADGFTATRAIYEALPGLGTFVPPSAKLAAAFLSVMNVFALWNAVVLALGMRIVARLSGPIAAVTALVMLLGTGLFPLIGAAFQT